MPFAPKPPCPIAYCPNKKPCPAHARIQDKQRGTARERGYTSEWDQYAKRYLQHHPLCAMCEARGLIEAAELVDHCIPIHGPNDPRFWDPTNHQSLSRKCHAVKTANDKAMGLTRQ